MSEMTVSFTMHGIGVSGGIAIGQAHLFAGMSAEANHYEITAADVQREQRRADLAVRDDQHPDHFSRASRALM